MASQQSGEILKRLRDVSEARKSFDTAPEWRVSQNRRTDRLNLIALIRLNDVLFRGVSIRLATPVDAWEEDVYGHVEVRLPGVQRALRVSPVEWKPFRYHDNPATSPPPHRNQRLWDRWHPFDLNAPLGIGVFDQSACGIAVPLPRDPATFLEYADLCADLWRCPDMIGLTPPPWARTML